MFQLLRTFLSVYATHNFTRSADYLFLSQPTVSSQIKKLEEMLTVPLFIRNGKQEITPTPAADYMYPIIEKIVKQWDDAVDQITEKQKQRKSCTIVSSHFCAVFYLPKLVSQLLLDFPHVDFIFKVGNNEEVLHLLEENKADLGLIEQAENLKEFVRTPLAVDELVLAGDLDSEYWLLGNDDLTLRQFNQQYLQTNHLMPKIIEIDTDEMIGSMLKNHVGRSIVPKCTLSAEVSYRPLDKENIRHFYLLMKREINVPIILEINEHIKNLAQSYDLTHSNTLDCSSD
ncbi:LysR family transcriptional regulator [Enterococcus columbae]|uniref:HTH lysR-type domain-containing protein n=1 Tax=Enterococcus columbae DSM 7374 = ATCC 51263 TaxID=1121865 RepID=S1NTD6_9ENTE|nr:LysR family transcriptional regulator [Enterococcus columbae]EOT44876.1 hypothetical protein OMW_00062 [Enterococcus columbae DSM 7374 = ATCC 51263]EOW84169.1 hypothetical protein I568_00656 [Enterococcus columbae DSM 7374 = ATCC 51263]OJG24919.1 hypothetical protein RR47_GL002013 [Enterococcus columbae DSM 7374 = ATCC 51263]